MTDSLQTLIRARDTLLAGLASCLMCPRACRVNRVKGELGFCRTGRLARVDSAFLHFGEEEELVGNGGSGTIFFSYCNLGCVYCQNSSLSCQGQGSETTAEGLADMMLLLAAQGAENINCVTPTHVTAQILEALVIARGKGLVAPLVYNCGGYESIETLSSLEGIFDIYMPDLKYSEPAAAAGFSAAGDYWPIAQAALREMHRQVGDLVVEGGRAKRGLLVRHLVLPNRIAGSFEVLDFLKTLSVHTYVNIMDQYVPHYRASQYQELNRPVTAQEYREVITYARSIGLYRGFA